MMSQPQKRNSRVHSVRQRRALTLMELVVVLAILAAMATAATVAADRVLLQRRFELTRQSLDSVSVATLGRFGPGKTIDQTSTIDGFIADLGRLPLVTGADAATQSAELWSNPRGLPPYGWKQSEIDPEVSLACGWRGPYLVLPTGAMGLQDGWGRPFIPLQPLTSGVPVAAVIDAPIGGWLSLGSDGATGTSLDSELAFSEDLSMMLVSGGTTIWSADIVLEVAERSTAGELIPPQGEGTLTVRLFGPHPDTGNVASYAAAPLAAPFSEIPKVTFPQITIGGKVVRAYFQPASGSSRRSSPQRIEVTRSGVSHWTLVLPHSPPSLPEGEVPAP